MSDKIILQIVQGDNYKAMTAKVEDLGGQCPCVPKYAQTKDTACICKDFKDQQEEGHCHCRRFKKVKKVYNI